MPPLVFAQPPSRLQDSREFQLFQMRSRAIFSRPFRMRQGMPYETLGYDAGAAWVSGSAQLLNVVRSRLQQYFARLILDRAARVSSSRYRPPEYRAQSNA